MAETPRTSTERCMAILLHTVLDHVELWDILRAMRVNRLWREYAINHPTYYRDLWLFEQGPLDNHDFFLLRLSRSNGRPIAVTVEQTPSTVMQEVGIHLAHITDLVLDVSSADSVGAVLQHLCRPAPVLNTLQLHVGSPTGSLIAPPTIPTDLLAHHALALNEVSVMGLDLSSGFPACFSTIKVLSFASWMCDRSEFVLPSPFGQCPKLRELCLLNRATLHANAVHSSYHDAWKRMNAVRFVGTDIVNLWPAFQLPLHDIPLVYVAHGDANSVLALSDTLQGPLNVTFPPMERLDAPGWPALLYTALLRGASRVGNHSRVYEGYLEGYASASIFAFSMPPLADRVARLELELDGWDNLIGGKKLGPFSALDELVLNLKDGAEFTRPTAWPELSCPKLRRLVLHGTQPNVVFFVDFTQADNRPKPNVTVDIGAVATFASAALPEARFPLSLVVDRIELAGACSDFPKTFSQTLSRGT